MYSLASLKAAFEFGRATMENSPLKPAEEAFNEFFLTLYPPLPQSLPPDVQEDAFPLAPAKTETI